MIVENQRRSLAKYSGTGNTFLIGEKPIPTSSIPSLCSSSDVDGVILFQKMANLHFEMSIFNSDGSEAEMCGNGLRCLIDYLSESKKSPPYTRFSIETKAGLHEGWKEEHEVCVLHPLPHSYIPKVEIEIENQNLNGSFANSGVPHFVVFQEEENIEKIGREIRHHSRFAPEGTNVNFVKFEPPFKIYIRTYERGVEKETQACGTGAVASAFCTMKKFCLNGPFQVTVRSGEILRVHFSNEHAIVKGKTEYITSFSLNEKSLILDRYE